MAILIIGNGQIGKFYLEHYTKTGTPARIATGVDITDFDQVEKAVEEFQPSIVINTAAATSLEWCGLNRTRAFEVNVLGAANVARVCDRTGTYLIHFSSGCIFSSADGADTRKEEDRPDPASYYGWTKVWSEELVNFERSERFECLILRPRQPVSSKVNHKNMLVKMLTFSKFVDTPNSGTVIEDLMEWTDVFIDRRVTGVFHVANEGWTTPYKIGLMLKQYVLPGLPVERIEKTELDRLTPNIRVDTVLDVSKLDSMGVKVGGYEERLEATIRDLARNIASTSRDVLRQELDKTAAASRQRTVVNDVFMSLCNS